MAFDIFKTPHVMRAIATISEQEENRYSDIPGWEGMTGFDTAKGVFLVITKDARTQEIFFPYSQMRKAEDEQSIYASNWILEQKGL